MHWKLKLNLIDLELGRSFWVSKYLALRPFIGLRYASIKQHADIHYNGGSWIALPFPTEQLALNDEVDLQNNYRGAGVRAGLDSQWNFGCGWAFYGNLAASIIYGRFRVDHDERITPASNTPRTSIVILDTTEHLRAARPILDLALGVQWSTMFCSCKYGFTAMFGWESHLFFNQNQLWRVSRVGATPLLTVAPDPDEAFEPFIVGNISDPLNLSGNNVFDQRRGLLDTSGWTLSLIFDF
jgi:hypothetical protein